MAYTFEGRLEEIELKLQNAEDKLHILEDHIHSVQYVYPTLASGVTLNASSSVWQLGSFVEVIPKNTIDDVFDIHWLNVGAMNNVTTCELHLYKGDLGSEILIAQTRVVRLSNQSGAGSIPIITPLISANERISAKLASATANTTLVISVSYHKY
jgi:hypothetical protein